LVTLIESFIQLPFCHSEELPVPTRLKNPEEMNSKSFCWDSYPVPLSMGAVCCCVDWNIHD